MINAIKSIFKAISGFFAFVNGILLPKAHELISAIVDSVSFIGGLVSSFFSSAPAIVVTAVGVALVVTIAKLIGGRQ